MERSPFSSPLSSWTYDFSCALVSLSREPLARMDSACLRWRWRHLAAATLFFSRRVRFFSSALVAVGFGAVVVSVVVVLLLLSSLLALAFRRLRAFRWRWLAA
jgi:hypothetical protein